MARDGAPVGMDVDRDLAVRVEGEGDIRVMIAREVGRKELATIEPSADPVRPALGVQLPVRSVFALGWP